MRMLGERTTDIVTLAPLLITAIPRIGLIELQAAIADTIYWHQHHPITREDRIARDRAFVRLMQAQWHVGAALGLEKAA
jgi:hypothetical protein